VGDGVPAVTKQLFHLVPMNDANALEDLLKKKRIPDGAYYGQLLRYYC
jgi:hypothetical protein